MIVVLSSSTIIQAKGLGRLMLIRRIFFATVFILALSALTVAGHGSINIPGNRVTVGRNGQVAANISAREIVVLGKVRGNVAATDRVDIRAEGSLSGDVAASRISIEDGAFFKGGIDIRKPGQKVNGDAKDAVETPTASVARAGSAN